MRYLTKMRIGSYIAGIITVIFTISSMIIFVLHCTEATSDITAAWFFAIFAILAALVVAHFMEKSTKKVIEKSEEFSMLVKYCYFCGASLEKTETIERCPKCGAKLKVLDVIEGEREYKAEET